MNTGTGFEALGAEHEKIPGQIPDRPVVELTYDDFEKETLLGTGGSAQVYLAAVDSPELDSIALKEPRFDTHQTDGIAEMFANEAELWSYLDHEYITSVLDWGTEPNPWIALEFADGGTLSDHLQSTNLEQSLWIAVCLANAVKYAHNRGVVHLDLKPQNILFRQTPGDTWDVPNVTDWGLAKLLLKYTGEIEGLSYHYAAPEQLRPETYEGADEKTDVYQLGGVIYALLSGQPPVQGSKREMVDATLAGDIDPPSSVNPALPNSLDQPIMRALKTDPTNRYEDILLLRQALERAFLDIHAIEDSKQPGVNVQRTGEVGASGPAGGVDAQWTVDAAFELSGPPSLSDDSMFISTKRGSIHELSVHSGTVHWGKKLSDASLSAPVVGNEGIYLTDHNGAIYAISPERHTQKWALENVSLRSPPIEIDGNLLLTGADGTVIAFDPPGTVLWQSEAPGKVHAPSAIRGERIFVPTYQGLASFRLDTGAMEWGHQPGAPFTTAPAVVGDTVYATGRNCVIALDVAAGDLRWRYDTDANPTGIAVTPSHSYVSTKGGELLSIDTTTGTEQWRFQRQNHELTPPIVGDSSVFIGCSGPGSKSLPARMDDVHAIDTETGDLRWSWATDSEVSTRPVIAGDSLIVADVDGKLYLLG